MTLVGVLEQIWKMQRSFYRLIPFYATIRERLCDFHQNLHLSRNSSTRTLRKSFHTQVELSLKFQFYPYHPGLYHQLNHMLQAFVISRDLRAAKSVHTFLLKLYFTGLVSAWNKLLSLYCNSGKYRIARHMFDEMTERDVVSYNTMVSAYIRNGHAHNALGLYSLMNEENILPNHITLACLINAFASGHQFHAHVIRYGLSWNQFVGSSLVDHYAKLRRLDDAIRAFSEITELDLVSWNITIDACATNNSKQHALNLFSRMLSEDIGFDGFTLTSIIKTCAEPWDLYCGMSLHCMAIKSGLSFETPIKNSLITMYSRCEEGMASARKIFVELAAPNIISWTAIITGFMQKELNEEVIGIYRRMLELGVEENDFTFASILPAYGNMAELDQGRQMHARIFKSKFGGDISVNNALIDMYSKCGSLEDAQLVFSTMRNRDVVSCSSMITCFGQHGKGMEALGVLRNMLDERLDPDDITFLGCLSACSHCGLLDEGIQVFKMMVDMFHCRPRKEHFACIVDMLGRAGRLKEAEMFISDAGIESDVSVWETLLGACTIHGEMELGQKVAEKVMELQPEKHGTYVMLANMHADRKLWEEKGNLRERLGGDGLKKEVGYSWVS